MSDEESIQRSVHAGEVCARCIASFPVAASQRGKRLCAPCAVRSLREIVANVMRTHAGYSVHFLEADCHTRVGPWLLLVTAAEAFTLLLRGNITDQDLATYEQGMRSWGQTSVHLWLDPKQYARLVADGIRRPWNGYEERKRQGRD